MVRSKGSLRFLEEPFEGLKLRIFVTLLLRKGCCLVSCNAAIVAPGWRMRAGEGGVGWGLRWVWVCVFELIYIYIYMIYIYIYMCVCVCFSRFFKGNWKQHYGLARSQIFFASPTAKPPLYFTVAHFWESVPLGSQTKGHQHQNPSPLLYGYVQGRCSKSFSMTRQFPLLTRKLSHRIYFPLGGNPTTSEPNK